MDFQFQPTAWFGTTLPVFAGTYEAELSDGRAIPVKFQASGWDLASASVSRWRGQQVYLTEKQTTGLRRVIHAGRYAAVKREAQEAALWLARSFVIRAANDAQPEDQRTYLKTNACGWYQIARRLGVDIASNVAPAWEADAQALAKFWPELPSEAQARITVMADRFKDGSGDRLLFD
ncbi:hypothetical protein AB3X91_37840 [Paraburkholderia sp. BR14263]|uniref:hypothetical protein n=1 Tax=unclassified Paraburkholderia TaxID=2615204 RepID=UPI0034CF76C1